jgi:hypothetical protein
MFAYGTCSGSDLGTPQVNRFPKARVQAAAAYKDYDQTFYWQPVLERWVNGAWTSKASLGGAVGLWSSTTLPVHTGIPWIGAWTSEDVGYREISFAGGWNVQPGYYRIRYEFRWYVGTTLLGWGQDYAQTTDIEPHGDRATVTSGTAPSSAAFCHVW